VPGTWSERPSTIPVYRFYGSPTGGMLIGEANGSGIWTPTISNKPTNGAVTYYVSEFNSGAQPAACESPRTAVTIYIRDAPDIAINPPANICEYEPTPVFTAMGTTQGSLVEWYYAAPYRSEGFEAYADGTGNPFRSKFDGKIDGPGTYQIYATQRINFKNLGNASDVISCVSRASTTTLRIKPQPISPTLTGSESCYGDVIKLALKANVNANWYRNGVLQTATPTHSFIPVETAPNYVPPHIYLYQATQTVDGCESEKATVAYRIKELPRPPVLTISKSQICSYDNDPAINATLQPLVTAIDPTARIRWYSSANSATQLPQFDNQLQITTDRNITLNYYATQEVEGCTSPFAVTSYKVTVPLPAPTTFDVEMCVNATSTPFIRTSSLNAKWYRTAGLQVPPYTPNEAPIGAGLTFQPPKADAIPPSVTYWVQDSFEGCLSPMSPVTMTVKTDASCFPVPGCTNSEATNYDPLATQDDGSCVFPIIGCTDNTALNYNQLATKDDASCEYSITVAVAASTGGTVSGGGAFTVNKTATVKAVAASGYSFTAWQENGVTVSTEANYTFTVTGKRNLTCVFEKMSFQIKVTSIPAGAGDLFGGGTYSTGDRVQISAFANSGYTFVNWIEDGEVISLGGMHSFTVSKNRNLIAVFRESKTDISGIVIPKDKGIAIVAGEESARVAWNAIKDATGYKLVIKDSEGALVCSLEFDAGGRLVSLVFAPNTLKADEVFGVRLTNLTANTTYYYTMEIMGKNNAVIETKTGTFKTKDTGTAAPTLEQSQLTVYPNPTNGQLTISGVETQCIASLPQTVEIYDNTGRLVKTRRATSLHGNGLTIDISHLPNGVYFVHINGQRVKVVKK